MFRAIIVEQWQATLTIISFAIFLTVFAVTLLRTWRMTKPQIEHVENLPLQDDTHEQ